MAGPQAPRGDGRRRLADVVIATHRGPVTIVRDEAGELVAGPPAGGLASSLTRALSGTNATWLACPMHDLEREAGNGRVRELVAGLDVRYLDIDPQIVADAYNTIANETLWFVLHGLAEFARVTVDDAWWRAYGRYREYNAAFGALICEHAAPGATVMVNDYHLLLVGTYLRRHRPDLRTTHFLHTPFPAPDELAALPGEAVRELLEGLASFGAAGFHTERWADAFRACCATWLVMPPEVYCAPLGVDAAALIAEAGGARVAEHRARNRARFAGRQVIFRNDRLEPTKNIARGFLAYRWLLEREPGLASTTVFYARSYLSRAGLPLYRACREEIERTVAGLNAACAPEAPVVFEIDNDYDATLAGYRDYDVLLVNPILDGMNLVAKEAPILNERDGVEVLSYGAGAYDQLAEAVIGIDPLDVPGTGRALAEALAVSAPERERRHRLLGEISARRPPAAWLAETLAHARLAPD